MGGLTKPGHASPADSERHAERSGGSPDPDQSPRSAQHDRCAATDDRGATWATRSPPVILALVLVVALGVRLWGVAWQLPWQFHPDEGHYTWKALDMLGEDSLNPKYFRNPSLFTYLLLAQYRLLGFQAPSDDAEAASSTSLLRPPSGVAFVGRLNSALLGWATVAALAWIGWRTFGPWTGVLAAAFLGMAFIHVRDSHYATNDVPATFLLVLSVGASLELLRQPTLRPYLLAGLLGGLATSTKYNAGLFVVPLVFAHLLARSSPHPAKLGYVNPLPEGEGAEAPSPSGRGLGVRAARKARAILGARSIFFLAAALAAAALGYLFGTPYTLLTPDKFWADFRTQMRLGGDGWEGQVASPSALLYLQTLWQGLGWAMFALALVGLILLARRRPRRAAVLAAFPIAYLLFMLQTELFFVRFALPVAPFLCLLAAAGVVLAADWTGHILGSRIAPALGISLAVAALVQPTLNVALHDRLVTRGDTRVLAAEWALANIPPDAKVALEDYTIRDRRPRAYDGPAWQLDTDLFDVNDVRAADPCAALRGRYRYFITSSFQSARFAGEAGRRQAEFYACLEREGRLVAHFGPGERGTPLPFDLEDLYTPFWNLGYYERPGPTIRIYAIGPSS